MHLADWLILTVPLIVCAAIALYTRRYVRGVADFMAGGRNAGRYLVCAARSEQGAGAGMYVASFQIFMISGFTVVGWWHQLAIPVGLLLTIVGFVGYRYRETRALTLGQFFEMRYSRKFRLFTGMLGFFAGLVNFGVIPVIGARFMVFFLDLPPLTHVLGLAIPTYLILMAIFLSLCVVMTTTAGQVSVLLVDCAEGMISQVLYSVIAIAMLLFFFHWADTRAVLLAAEPGKSLVNPFDTRAAENFNIWYAVVGIFLGTYRTMAWQNSHAFSASASSPHEARMGGILGRWRHVASTVMVTLLAVCALTYLKSPEGSVAVEAAVSQIKDPSTADQMRVPIALTQMLPVGIKGALLCVVMMGIIGGDGIHLHSWGSIFIQDVVMPLRKKPLSTRQHLLYLRLAIVGVALWAFMFGALFPQTKYLQLWWSVTESIFVSGAGIAIIGGIYWSRGTTAGAWSALILGSSVALTGIGLQVYSENILHRPFLLHGQQIALVAALTAITTYTVVSLLTCRTPHNMDKLLHRGQYAIKSDTDPVLQPARSRFSLYRLLGIDGQFSRSDRWITIGIFTWSMTWFACFAVGSGIYLWGKYRNGGTPPWTDSGWASYWLVTAIYLPVLIGVGTTIWFSIGCWHDVRAFFKRLREESVDAHDDGTVSQDEDAEPTKERELAQRV